MQQSTDATVTKGERVRRLRMIHLNLSQTDFGQAIARDGTPVSQNYISAIERGDRQMGPDVQHRIQDRFRVRKQWLDEGVGEVFQGERPVVSPTSHQIDVASRPAFTALTKRPASSGNVVWVSGRDVGAFLRSDGTAPNLPRTNLPQLAGEAVAFEVTHPYLLPDFPVGSFVICSRLDTPLDMAPGRPYVVQTADQLYFGIYNRTSTDETIRRFWFSYTHPDQKTLFMLNVEDVKQAFHVELKLAKP